MAIKQINNLFIFVCKTKPSIINTLFHYYIITLLFIKFHKKININIHKHKN